MKIKKFKLKISFQTQDNIGVNGVNVVIDSNHGERILHAIDFMKRFPHIKEMIIDVEANLKNSCESVEFTALNHRLCILPDGSLYYAAQSKYDTTNQIESERFHI